LHFDLTVFHGFLTLAVGALHKLQRLNHPYFSNHPLENQCPEPEVAQELYFRIQAGEQSFAECARAYSTGPEAQTGGLLGPMELSQPHPTLATLLSTSQPGQLWPPIRLGEWLVIVRLEKLLPAQLDEPMRQQLLNAQFEAWVQEQIERRRSELLANCSSLIANPSR
jgi:parvulin-like peptidyl-prolyl isomerase